jgi:hypothetical protein
MNFALLGTSSLIRQFEAQLADSSIHQRVFASTDLSEVELIALEQSGAEVIIFGGIADEEALLRAMPFLKAFKGTVFIAPLSTRAVLTAYEFERLAGECVGALVPLLPSLQHPGMQLLNASAGNSTVSPLASVGEIERVDMQRALPSGDVESVLDAFAEDITILVALAGSIKEVVAMRTGSEPIPLNVQSTSKNGRLVRWSAVRPSQEIESAQILIEGTQGRVLVRLRETGVWDIESNNNDLSSQPPDLLAHCALINSLTGSSWEPFTHSLEVREAVEKSLNRGRLVRINLDGHGERTAFMGTMASLGCALLLGSLGILIFSAAILSFAPENRFGRLSVWVEKVPWLLAAVMILFLIIQFFAFVIPGRSED